MFPPNYVYIQYNVLTVTNYHYCITEKLICKLGTVIRSQILSGYLGIASAEDSTGDFALKYFLIVNRNNANARATAM